MRLAHKRPSHTWPWARDEMQPLQKHIRPRPPCRHRHPRLQHPVEGSRSRLRRQSADLPPIRIRSLVSQQAEEGGHSLAGLPHMPEDKSMIGEGGRILLQRSEGTFRHSMHNTVQTMQTCRQLRRD